jgi:hypothetical protein
MDDRVVSNRADESRHAGEAHSMGIGPRRVLPLKPYAVLVRRA